MENLNFLPIIVAALIPMIVGFTYYHKSLFGNAWMKSLGKTEAELMEGSNMAVTMSVSLFLSFLLAFFINALIELVHKDVVNGELAYMSDHTFMHGAMHGAMLGIFAAIVIITNGLYERKTWTNMLINVGYWILTFALIGGLTDAWN